MARWVYAVFGLDKKYYLVIDRTNWFWGKSKINILTLGLAYEGVAIPLMWNLLDKAGNATTQEHQSIIINRGINFQLVLTRIKLDH